MLRQLIAATAVTLAASFTSCTAQSGVAPLASDSPTAAASAPSVSSSSGVELTATSIGPLKIGEATQDQAVDYLDQTLGESGRTTGDEVCDSCQEQPNVYEWAGLSVYTASTGKADYQVTGWRVFAEEAPPSLRLSSGLSFAATVAEVQAAFPGTELQRAKAGWTIADPVTGITFAWQGSKTPSPDQQADTVSSPDAEFE